MVEAPLAVWAGLKLPQEPVGVQVQSTPALVLSFATVAATGVLPLISSIAAGAVVMEIVGVAGGVVCPPPPPHADRNIATVHASAIKRALRFIADLPFRRPEPCGPWRLARSGSRVRSERSSNDRSYQWSGPGRFPCS